MARLRFNVKRKLKQRTVVPCSLQGEWRSEGELLLLDSVQVEVLFVNLQFKPDSKSREKIHAP